jgi:MFS family permease
MLAFALVGFSIGQTAFIPAVPGLARKLDVSTAAATWAVTASLLSSAVLTPVLGRLGDLFGRRRLFVAILAAVCLGSVISALAWNLPGILLGRIFYGAGAGLFPVGFGIVRDVLPAARRGQAIGVLAALGGLGGGIGPAVGGGLVELGSYSTIFWVGLLVGILPALSAPWLVGRGAEPSGARVDWWGVLLLSAGLTAPLVAITQAVKWGWLDARTCALAAAGVAMLVVFARVERRLTSPLLNMGIALQPRVARANSATLLVGFANYAPCALIPLLALVPARTGYGLGLGPAGAGLLMAPGCAAMVFTAALGGRLRHRIEARVVLAVGGACSATGLVAIAFTLGSRLDAAIGSVLVFAGVGLAVGSIANLVVDAVPSGQTGEATGVNTVSRIVGATLGTQVAVAILASGGQVDGSPPRRAFVLAFLVGAAAALTGAAVALRIRGTILDKNYAHD